jgi:hypothetical protein
MARRQTTRGSSTRSPYHWGTKSSVSGSALSTRTRFRFGSKYATSTNLAPRLYAASAVARARSSRPISAWTSTLWPFCTVAPWTEWSAQAGEHVACFPGAHAAAHSIQAGSAKTPSPPSGRSEPMVISSRPTSQALRRPRAARPLRSSRTHLAEKDAFDLKWERCLFGGRNRRAPQPDIRLKHRDRAAAVRLR